MWTTKIERAKKHINELQVEIDSFLSTQPYKIETRRDSVTKRPTYYISEAQEVPITISTITGDVIQNLRSSLDHLAYQLYQKNKGHTKISKYVEFPIEEDLSSYLSKRKNKTNGMSAQAKKLIESVKPYREGNNLLWQIHKLNIIDKHRLLLAISGTGALESIDLGELLGSRVNDEFLKALKSNTELPEELSDFLNSNPELPNHSAFFELEDTLTPLKEGDVLFTDAPNAKIFPVTFKLNLNIVIVENDVTEIKGTPLIEVLNSMVTAVENLIPIFEPILST